MPLYIFDDNEITAVPSTTFADQNMKERQHLQALLKRHPEVISPNTLIVAEEFGDWEDSLKRIDLLGVDKSANLVVIELKRTDDGGHMDLQAIRYSAMISAMSFNALVSTYDGYLKKNNRSAEDARENLRDFLEWSDSDDEVLGQEIKIVLASAGFSKELTTSVLWLNDRGLDIRCVRLDPYDYNGQVMVDVQTIIPLPETEEYQIRIREKRQSERVARASTRDYSKYDVTIGGEQFLKLNKRKMVLQLVKAVFHQDGTPERVNDALPKGKKLKEFDGELDADRVRKKFKEEGGRGSLKFERFFWKDPFPLKGKTYVLSNQWAGDAVDAANNLREFYPDLKIEITESNN
ncbi:MAG: hypothetical protein OXC26_08605 [Albidovulum sp.]|nr:hypothetical protein [Albidovulum sp.]